MITELADRQFYIGGSEANMIYMNYDSKTFIKWWSKKLDYTPEEKYTNLNMSVGTILENDIIDLYERLNGVQGLRGDKRTKGIARANTDYIIDDKVYDVKATNKAFEWYLKNQVYIGYRRQLLHYCYVYGFKKAAIIAYQVNDDLLNNPFQELDESRLFEIEVEITEKDLEIHRQKIEFLEQCRELGVYP